MSSKAGNASWLSRESAKTLQAELLQTVGRNWNQVKIFGPLSPPATPQSRCTDPADIEFA